MVESLCPIQKTCVRFPNKTALLVNGITHSYKDLNECVQGAVEELTTKGIKKEQRVAFIAKPCIETIVLFFALFRMKAIACPLSQRLPLQTIDKALEQLDAHFFLHNEPVTLSKRKSAIAHLEEEQLTSMLFTSGTSGSPKIACHSLGNHLSSALSSNEATNLQENDTWILSLPLFHVGGIAILFRCFFAGASIAISDEDLLSSLLHIPITHLSLVPTQLYRLMNEDPFQLEKISSKLKCILLGGAPIPFSLYNQALERGLKIFPTYGMTEMSSQITMDRSPEIGKLTSGAALTHAEISLKDKEILVRGKMLFQGYFDKEKNIDLPTDEEGWFHTKDLGEFTKDGKLLYLGRKDHLFISGGENIQPEEIEEALLNLEGILEAVVVPASDPEFGARPIAFIHDKDRLHTLQSIKEKLKKVLPSFKHPIAIYPMPLEPSSLKRSRAYFQKLADQMLKN